MMIADSDSVSHWESQVADFELILNCCRINGDAAQDRLPSG